MKIIVDAFGGDNAPLEILKACAEAVTDFDIDILLTGDQDEIRRVAKENNISLNRMEIIHAPSVITMEDEPTEITKGKSDSSMAEGCRSIGCRQRRCIYFQPETVVLWLWVLPCW